MSNISVLLADDHNIVRHGLKALLIAEGDINVIAEAQNGREAVQLAAKLYPEIVVMDLAMPLLNGWEATRQIMKAVPTVRVVVLSTYGDDEHVQQAIAAGAASIILVHNHPSGDPSPSEADIRATRDLIRAGQVLKIEVLDHVIIGAKSQDRPKDYVSLRELVQFYP